MYFRESFTRSVPLCYQALTRLKLSLWDFDRSHRLLCGSDCRVVDESALLSAIKFNSGHANWVIEDYMRAHLKKGIHGYEQLRDFLKAYPEFEIKAAIQLIKGKYSTKEFKEGALKISDEEYMEASKKAAALCLISTKVVFRRGGILPRMG